MSPSRGTTTNDIGPVLIRDGCRQGALFEAPARMVWLTREKSEQEWSIENDEVGNALLIVVSQDCDINAPIKSEPRVEAMTARRTTDPTEIHTARKGNSARLFYISETVHGTALVADARRRVYFDKRALVGLGFKPAFSNERTRKRFAEWLAGRYNRPAIPNNLINAIQKPLVVAVDNLRKKNDVRLDILDRIAELRFSVVEDQPPWTVRLVVMIDEEDEITTEEEAELMGWLEDVLVIQADLIKEIVPSFKTDTTISLRDYYGTTRLQLDQFSPEEGKPVWS